VPAMHAVKHSAATDRIALADPAAGAGR
jgi:hypothetical protein